MKRRTLAVILFALAAILLLTSAYLFWQSGRLEDLPSPTVAATATPSPSAAPVSTAAPTPSPTEAPAPSAPALEEPAVLGDKLFITPERQRYADGDLQLLIPTLEVDVTVLNGVDSDTLLKGVGLYDYAQLPGEGDRNVSLAGHRNWIRGGKITLDQPFSYLDTLVEGDYLYLRDADHIYQYVFDQQTVVEPDDWGPIYTQGFSCLTLTTCTPVGVSDHRLIIRARLVDTLDRTDDFVYPLNESEASSK